jgi:hypothetical protein
MSTNFDTYVIGLFANNQSRNAAARLGNPDNPASWTWYNIESTHFDCVTNMLGVLAHAKSAATTVEVRLDGENKIIDVIAAGGNMTQEESKRLMNEGSTNSP